MAMSKENRFFKLHMTFRQACLVIGALRRERKRREKDHQRHEFKPEPGKHDSNLMRISVMDDMISQLQPQMERHKEREERKTHANGRCRQCGLLKFAPGDSCFQEDLCPGHE